MRLAVIGALRRACAADPGPLRPWWPLLPLGLVGLASLVVLATRVTSWLQQPGLFAGCALALGAVCLAGFHIVRTRRIGPGALAWILVVGLGLQLVGVGLYQSDDVARYVVEGRQILAGQNPYAIPPGDARAAALVDPTVAATVNHPTLTAIYPPVSLAAHAAVVAAWPAPAGFTAAGLLAAVLIIALALALLVRHGRPPGHIVLVAWNPVLAIFGSGESHNDLLLAVALLSALLAASWQRHRLGVGLAALACLCKPFAVVALPAFLAAGRWRGWWLVPLLPVLAYLPFLAAGDGLVTSLFTFGGSMHYHGALDPWVRWALQSLLAPGLLEPAIRVVLAVLLVGGLWLAWRRHGDAPLPAQAARLLAVLLLCLPTLHPWYFLAFVPLLPFTNSWALPLWTALAGIYWLHGIGMQAAGTWVETPWVTALAHLPAVLLIVIETVRPSWRACPPDAESKRV